MLKYWLLAIFLCLAGVPLVIYFPGGLIVGPYEGDSGLLGLTGAIYGDALRGKLSAIALLLSPALLFGVWYGVGRWRRALP